MSDILSATRDLCTGLSTETLLALLDRLADRPSRTDDVVFAVVADAICRRWMIDGRPLAEASDPLRALREALDARGFDPVESLL